MLKQTFLKFIFCGALLLPLQSVADDFGITDIGHSNILIRNKANIKGNRPKAPSMQQIFCYYEDGQLTFDFAIPEGDCLLTVTDLSTNFARNYSFSSEAEATVYVGTLTEAYIEISTESGHEYEGYLGQIDY